jgi:Protein of unknown function (DUF2569)
MARKWQVVSPSQAKDHPLYGVKNWLAVFAFGVLFGVLRELGALAGEAHKADLTVGQFFAIDHPAVIFTKIALSLQVGVVSVIYWLLLTKHQNFRQVTTALLLCSWPAAALIGLANSFPGLGEALAMSFFSWAVSCAIWVTYLQRSKRVRITFEHCALSTETPSPKPANQEPSFTTPSATISQSTTPKPQRTPSLHRTAVAQIVASTPPKKMADAPMPTIPSEECWSIAMAEFDSPARRAGLWAMMFSQAEGNEPIAKAGYLRHRAAELHRDHVARVEEEARRSDEQARDATLAALFSQQREYAKLPKGLCPNCGDIVPFSSHTCPECTAMFGPLSTWNVAPFNEAEQVEALRLTFLAGKKPTPNQVIFLAAASTQDHSLTTLTDKTVRGDTLLHWCAQFGLANEATTLIANGANASATNAGGRKPFEVCIDMHLRGLLRSAAYTDEI